jgi:hypothetical protein
MEALYIEPTAESPKISLDKDQTLFEIGGISRPENVIEFYQPVMDWLKKYAENPLDTTDFHFRFDYFNTSSLKSLLIILAELKKIKDAGKELQITWHYDEEDQPMEEAGELLQDLSELEFVYKINEE